MIIDVKVPTVGESITEAVIGSWTKKSGEFVKMNDVIMLLETDKASVEVAAEKDGVLTIISQAGETVLIGAKVASIDTDGKAAPAPAAPATASGTTASGPTTTSAMSRGAAGVGAAGPGAMAGTSANNAAQSNAATPAKEIHPDLKNHLSPAVSRVVNENQIDPSTIAGTGLNGRITKEDALNAKPSSLTNGSPTSVSATPNAPSTASAAGTPVAGATTAKSSLPTYQPPVSTRQGDTKRVPMTGIRKKIAERLVQAQHTAAILTTFNEVDMSKIIDLRTKYKDKFKEKYGVNLGFNGFFVKAVIEALKAFPAVNAWVDGHEIEYHNYFNIGMAVSTDRGLMVPVIKDADLLTVAGVELAIRDLAFKGRDGKITPNDLMGGTFSITNGGVFGSLLSTPILNAPQSAILGLHKVEDRPVAIQGKVEVRPMMYVALSYDHRMIDGKEAVGFLVKIKEGVEDPERLLIEV